MLEGELAITESSWINGFKNVNLNPDETQPIEVWLSNISGHLEAAGDHHRCLQYGYNPTEEDVSFETNLNLLKAIKVPRKFEKLSPEGKKKVRPISFSPSRHSARPHMSTSFPTY